MRKSIKDLSESEIIKICDARDTVKRGFAACADCPLRYGKQCMYCLPPIVTKAIYSRTVKTIGNNEVEVQ